MTMTIAMICGVLLLAVVAVLQVFLLFRLSRGGGDSSAVLNEVAALRQQMEQVTRSVRDEIALNRQEQAAQSQGLRTETGSTLQKMSDSMSANAASLAQSVDTKLEAVRSGLEQRLAAFTAESGGKFGTLQSEVSARLTEFRTALVEQGTQTGQRLEGVRTGVEGRFTAFTGESATKFKDLTDALTASSEGLRNEVSGRLQEFTKALTDSLAETRRLQQEHAGQVAKALQSLQSQTEERQVQFHALVDGKLATLGQQTNAQLSEMRTTIGDQIGAFRESTGKSLKEHGDSITKTVDERLASIQTGNETKLEQMRQTVDEKLQGTLDTRLGESFKQVSDRLEQVYKGLGEMQTLAAGVGDLKRVLTNVKIRGTWGEVQLGALLEQMLTPEQYAANVPTTGTSERVEYAIRLPGPDGTGTPVWLPIDAKFPVEDYQRVVEASERNEPEALEAAIRQLEATVKLCAKTLSQKYIAPPATTDFGILFLATEGLYAETMRRPGLAEQIQRDHRVVLAGPSTLASMLNAFRMGFQTLAIQKRSSEVWQVLGEVKTEFFAFAGVLSKVKKKLGEAQNTVERVEVRTRAIERKLRAVEATSPGPSIEACSAGLLEEPEDEANGEPDGEAART